MDTLLASADPDALTQRLAELIDNKRNAAARTLMAAVRRMAPPSARLIELSARLAIDERRFADGLAELDAALASMPAQAGLRKCRAELRIHLDDAMGAASDAAEAVVLDPQDPAAKAILGFAMLELGRAREATLCLREAMGARPGNPAIRLGLAASQERSGDIAAARATLAEGVALAPLRPDFRRAWVLLCINQEDFPEGLRLAEAARAAGAIDACILGLIGHCLASLGRQAEAGEAYGEAVKLAPDDHYLRHLAASFGQIAAPPRAQPGYLRTQFDGDARRYDQLVVGLGYRSPGLIRMALVERMSAAPGAAPSLAESATLGAVLDLGCGTGLMGVVLSDIRRTRLVGIDLSARMLAIAETRRLYDGLHAGDIVPFLQSDEAVWQTIVAADTVCYFGDLTELLTLIFRRLDVAGVCVFTVDLPQGADSAAPAAQGWSLRSSGRYAHSRAHVEQAAAAAGLAIVSIAQCTLREPPEGPVAGLLVVLQRRDA